MKKIIIKIMLLFFASPLFAQQENFEKHLREELKAEGRYSQSQINSIVLKRIDLNKKAIPVIAGTLSSNIFEAPLLSSPCINSGFETSSDFTNYSTFGWAGFGANTFAATGFVPNTITSGLQTSSVIPGFQNQTSYTMIGTMSFGGSYHAIVNSGTDPNISTLPTSISGKSLRLGNDNHTNGAEIISKTFTVPPGMNKFKFKTATVCVPDKFGRPGFFSAKAVSASGLIVDEFSDIGVSTNPFFNSVGGFYYRLWHIVELDVSSLIGQQVTIVIINTDCFFSGHKQYVYLDDFCTTDQDTQEGYIDINPVDSCNKLPLILTGTFALPNITGNPAVNPTINIGFYQNGVLQCSKSIPAPSGTTYSIPISSTDCPNLTGCIDVVATLSFKLKDMNGALQTVTKTSGNINSGFRPGQNNDICFDCCSCSQTLSPFLSWIEQAHGGAGQIKKMALACGETYTDNLVCYKSYSLQTLNPCGENCTPDEYISTIKFTPAAGSGASPYTTTGSTLVANIPGKYEVTIKVKCNGAWCKECKITFIQTKKCEPPCDNCKDKVEIKFNPGGSTATPKKFPSTSGINAAFLIGGGTDLYTQVRFNVVDVQLSSDNPLCLQCYNMPNQWVSITGGSLSGFTPKVTSYSGVSALNGNNNPREIVFDAAMPTAVTNSTAMNLSINIPGYNPLSCCCLKIVVFIKVTFRNNKCEECSKTIPVVITECPSKDDTTGGIITFEKVSGQLQFKQHSPGNEDAKLLEDKSFKIN